MKLKGKTLHYISVLLTCLLLITGLIHVLTSTDKKEAREDAGKGKKESIPKPQNKDKIRVLIKTNGFAQIAHPEISLSAPGGLVVKYADQTVSYAGDEVVSIKPDSEMFAGGRIKVESKEGEKITVANLNRGYGVPAYRGMMELIATAEGIVLINELPLEEYLYAVVPSEMPSSYEAEALKVQAVCARSYAYCQMESFGYPEYEAHVDDSVSFQVYGNSAESEKTMEAIAATDGEKIKYNGKVVKAYFFSTSCGYTTSVEAWGTKVNEENGYLASTEVKTEESFYEESLPWYRWQAVIPEAILSNLISVNTVTDIGNLEQVEVTKRGPGNIALQIVAIGTDGSVTVDTENKIRSALGGSGYQITRQDKSVADSATLLPSAFFDIKKENGNFIIDGGGYGHGIGMSQNGANEMAKQGKDYKEILQLFYKDVEIAAN